jgi:hypothetical protein
MTQLVKLKIQVSSVREIHFKNKSDQFLLNFGAGTPLYPHIPSALVPSCLGTVYQCLVNSEINRDWRPGLENGR